MPQADRYTVKVEGLSDLRRALKEADHESALAVRRGLQLAGKTVLGEAQSLASSNDDIAPSSVAGYRSRVKGFNVVVVEQSLRKTTGLHAKYGELQLREALLPALEHKAAEIEAEFDLLYEPIEARFNL